MLTALTELDERVRMKDEILELPTKVDISRANPYHDALARLVKPFIARQKSELKEAILINIQNKAFCLNPEIALALLTGVAQATH